VATRPTAHISSDRQDSPLQDRKLPKWGGEKTDEKRWLKLQKSLLLLSPRTLSPAEFLLAPLPALLPQLFPCTGASLHGERAGDRPPIYERSVRDSENALPKRSERPVDTALFKEI
jgi:hypothetical protein